MMMVQDSLGNGVQNLIELGASDILIIAHCVLYITHGLLPKYSGGNFESCLSLIASYFF